MAPKAKNQKMSLGTFLGDQSLGSWADEMEDMPTPTSSGFSGERRGFGSSSFGASRDRDDFSSRPSYSMRDPLPLPTKPPYTAHLANLSFEVTVTDVETFFDGCQVSNVRIVEDKIDRRPKGFGYVEFETLDGLKEALTRSNQSLLGRTVKISVADPPKDRGEGRELNDWTRKGPLPDLPGAGASGGLGMGSRRPSERGYAPSDMSERSSSRRGPMDGGDGKTRDFSNWERKGPLSPTPGAAPLAGGPGGPSGPGGPGQQGAEGAGRLRRNDASFERRNVASWGEGRPEGSRPPRREFQERPEKPIPERTPTAAELDNQWRTKMKPDAPVQVDAPTPEQSLPSSPVVTATPPAPAMRPKLNLQKRTVTESSQTDAPESASGDPNASPFGAARPIDTAARERQIEEKLAAQRQKKEAEAKAEQEKRAAEKAAKNAERADKAASAAADAKSGPSQGKGEQAKESKENGSGESRRANFEILQRVQDEGPDGEDEDAGTVANGDAPDAPANGAIIGDKETKPREVVRDANGERNVETTAESLEDDGWSTVPTGKRNKRGGQRALAS